MDSFIVVIDIAGKLCQRRVKAASLTAAYSAGSRLAQELGGQLCEVYADL